MPFRAFGDSDLALIITGLARAATFQCPFGHSGILTYSPRIPICPLDLCLFQCPFGHSGILTEVGQSQWSHFEGCVSMPFRAFGDSDLSSAV